MAKSVYLAFCLLWIAVPSHAFELGGEGKPADSSNHNWQSICPAGKLVVSGSCNGPIGLVVPGPNLPLLVQFGRNAAYNSWFCSWNVPVKDPGVQAICE
jgi:hypothetical protein